MPRWQLHRWIGNKEIFRIFPRKGSLRRILQKGTQITVHELRPIRLIHRTPHQLSKGIMHRDIERRTAHQRRQPGHAFTSDTARRRAAFQQGWQDLLLEVVANFHRMPRPRKLHPSLRQLHAEILQCLRPLGERKRTGPDPRRAQRRFAPALCRLSIAVHHPHLHAGARCLGHNLRAELQRHPRLHGQEIKLCSDNADVCGFRHDYSGRGLSLVSGANQMSTMPMRYTNTIAAPAFA